MASSTNNSVYKGAGQLTREQFLFYETRTVAKLLCEGLSSEEVVTRIISDNLFQFPTEKSLRQISLGCIKRINSLNDQSLVESKLALPTLIASVL